MPLCCGREPATRYLHPLTSCRVTELFFVWNWEYIGGATVKALWWRLSFLTPVDANLQFGNLFWDVTNVFGDFSVIAFRVVFDLINLTIKFRNGFDSFANDEMVARWTEIIGLIDVKPRAILKNVVEVRRVEQPLVREIAINVAVLRKAASHTAFAVVWHLS
jgi:hypothetical protein